jgi:transposase
MAEEKYSVYPLKQELVEKYKDDPNKLIDLLLKQNPELKKVHILDKIWRSTYARFKRRPSFTYPSAYKHPQYYSFKKTPPITYRNLDVLAGTVEVQLTKDHWTPLAFRIDKRLKQQLRLLAKPLQIGNAPTESFRDHRVLFRYSYYDTGTGETFYAEPRGVKLVFARDALQSEGERHGKPYLYIAVDLCIETQPIVKDLKVGHAKRKAQLPDGTKILCIDMGQRDLAAITMTEIKKGKPVPVHLQTLNKGKVTKAWVTDIRGLTMDSLAAHERELSLGLTNMYKAKKQKTEGRRASYLPKGKQGFDQLRAHIAHSKENRYKNGAHIILATAIKNNADVIVMEWLENYKPTLARDRTHNRRRMQWSVMAIQDFLEQQVIARNMVLYKAPAYFTSKLCYRCGAFGVRCSLPTVTNWIRYYEHLYPNEKRRYIREQGGYFFYCPTCNKLVNADINASFNLAKAYMGEWNGGKWETPKYDEKQEGWKYKNAVINKKEFYAMCDSALKTIKSPFQNTSEF